MKIAPNDACPCGSGITYRKCCRPLHNGHPPATPEALMRSRYCAYAVGQIDYIMQTTHPESPHYGRDTTAWRRDLTAFSQKTRFAGLAILSVEGDTVTFRAALFEGPRDVSFTEKSLFRQHAGRWMYLSGEHR